MRMERIDGLHGITFFPVWFPVNCYLVEEEAELTLIDAALPMSAKGILAAAERIGKPITRIVLTHAHDDHVGALDALHAALPDAKVLISARDARLLGGDRTLDRGEPQMPIRGGVPKGVQTRADITLADGDRIGSLQAVSVPGHTPGSMAFLDTRSGALIAGDAFQTRGGVAVSGRLVPWFPFPAFATWNKEAAVESARRLRDLKPSVLAVGHGRMLKQPLAAMDRAIEAAAAAR
ncbi:MBL fold metallo-hydrolase [Paenibacillus mucilaginosus]|uniref:YobT n=1 Tax=Paenibacillus mucilaginosus (strain KNP414) TaxID=1036673 RepID=F8FNB9_PAEMK|nr:MBL fold metallo-hydrolase [Paenibacillus mucilaginosus]AEI38956.1 YobT [Paenibacillus mucilaginosus KNP414]MCG7216577.1 MBL fold metallo-hydrolase [Paenibacillus mucilaginosus]WDM28001.1 MBL fold metallo-hydrolase [Paenibacillus mucilaginosus]